jgi:hypothetical protein
MGIVLALFDDVPACTDLTTQPWPWVEEAGVCVLNQPFIAKGNVATASGGLASQYLAAWVIARLEGIELKAQCTTSLRSERKREYVVRALRSIAPFFEGSVATA